MICVGGEGGGGGWGTNLGGDMNLLSRPDALFPANAVIAPLPSNFLKKCSDFYHCCKVCLFV